MAAHRAIIQRLQLTMIVIAAFFIWVDHYWIVTLLILFVFREGIFLFFKTSTILHLGTGVDKVVGTIRFVLGMVVMRYQF